MELRMTPGGTAPAPARDHTQDPRHRGHQATFLVVRRHLAILVGYQCAAQPAPITPAAIVLLGTLASRADSRLAFQFYVRFGIVLFQLFQAQHFSCTRLRPCRESGQLADVAGNPRTSA
jgi:uncharacterized SAM-binding protein YcdF (DUF218 family)